MPLSVGRIGCEISILVSSVWCAVAILVPSELPLLAHAGPLGRERAQTSLYWLRRRNARARRTPPTRRHFIGWESPSTTPLSMVKPHLHAPRPQKILPAGSASPHHRPSDPRRRLVFVPAWLTTRTVRSAPQPRRAPSLALDSSQSTALTEHQSPSEPTSRSAL